MAKKVKITNKPAETIETSFKVPVDTTLDKAIRAVGKIVAPEFLDEAVEIIKASNLEVCKEFLEYYEKDSGNICCLVLDKTKQDLIAAGKLTLNPDDAFGHPFML